MAHSYTQNDGKRREYEHLGDFLGAVVHRCACEDVRLPVIITADINGLHIEELKCIDLEPPALPVGIAGGLLPHFAG